MMENSTEAQKNLISQHLPDNLQLIKELFSTNSDFIIHPWKYGPNLVHTAFSVYFKTLIQKKEHNYLKESLQDLVIHEVGPATTITPENIINFFEDQGVSAQTAKLLELFDQVVDDILTGHIVIFIDEWNKALSYDALNLEARRVTEPVNEPAVVGPREGTVENLDTNLGLLRMRLKNNQFKIEVYETGGKSKTKVAFGYLAGTVNPEALTDFRKKIAVSKQQEVLHVSYIEELIEDSLYSPFPQQRYTERPDIAVAALLDGKIVVLTEGSPSIMICPGLFVEFFSTSEDYYQRTAHASLVRLLRLIAFFMALLLPSIYIAFSTFHPELIPTVLLLTILDTREGIPFPAFLEALIMEFFFELLREAGLRLPKPVGSAVSIVGALVIGQAAIQANIASPMMVIIVASTGIASFSLPQYSMAVALRILRFFLMVCAATLGGFGLMIGFLLILIHLTCLRSLGQPYLSSLAPLDIKSLRDIFIRAPLNILLRSPRNQHQHKSQKNEAKKVE